MDEAGRMWRGIAIDPAAKREPDFGENQYGMRKSGKI
jgi:hypothetical protein